MKKFAPLMLCGIGLAAATAAATLAPQAQRENRPVGIRISRQWVPSSVQQSLASALGIPQDFLDEPGTRFVPRSRLTAEQLIQLPATLLGEFPVPAGYGASLSGAVRVFAHVADGVLTGQNRFYQTTFVLAGNIFYAASGAIEFFDNEGRPLTLQLQGQSGSRFPFTLQKAEQKRLVTSGVGTLKTGWARIVTDQPINATSSFGVRDAAGIVYSDVGIAESTPDTNFFVFADSVGDADTGVALVNPSETETIDVRMELFRKDGSAAGSRTVSLGPRGHVARFLTELFDTTPGILEFEGTFRASSGKVFNGITLRISGDQLTSLPMFQKLADNDDRIIPQIAKGENASAGIRYATSLIFINPHEKAASASVVFTGSDGMPWPITLGGKTSDQHLVDLPPRGAVRLGSESTGLLKTGWARISMGTVDLPLTVAAVFTVMDLQSRALTEVGIQGSKTSSSFQLIADSLSNFDTGLAVANTSSRAASVQILLLDRRGVQVAQTCLTLAAKGHQALFMTQLFAQVPDIQEFDGLVSISSKESLGVLALRSVFEKLTSTPLLTFVFGFAPQAVLEVLENLSGSSPATRFRIRLNMADLAVAGASLSVPEMGLQLDRVREGDLIAAGFLFADNSAGLFPGVMAAADVLRASRKTAQGIEFQFMDMSGTLIGTPQGGLRLNLLLNKVLGPGTNLLFSTIDLEILVRPGIILLPAAATSLTMAADLTSVPIAAGGQFPSALCRIRHNVALAAPHTTRANLTGSNLLFPGYAQLLTLYGSNFGTTPRIFFIGDDGVESEGEVIAVRNGEVDVEVPTQWFSGGIQVDSGNGRSNRLSSVVILAPRFEVIPATLAGNAATPFSLVLRQAGRQLATAAYELTLLGADLDLSTLTPGSTVGSGWAAGGALRGLTSEVDLKVQSSSSTEALVQIIPRGKDKAEATLRLIRESGTPLRVRMVYAPVSPVTSAGLVFYPFESRLDLNRSLLKLPAPLNAVRGAVDLESTPMGTNEAPMYVRRPFMFRTTGGNPVFQSTTTTAGATTTTTTQFVCTPSTAVTTTSSVRPTTTTLPATTTTVRPTTTTTSTRPLASTTTTTSTSTTRPTSSSSSTTSTSTSTSTSTLRPTTTTTLAVAACGLFQADFNDGKTDGWALSNDVANWQVLGGKLQVGSIQSGMVAMAGHRIPAPLFFQMEMDLEIDTFDGTLLGFEPYSETEVYSLQTVGGGVLRVDGIGAGIYNDRATGQLRACFTVFDVDQNVFLALNAQSLRPTRSVGIVWSSQGVTLVVDGVPLLDRSIPPSVFGASAIPVPRLNVLSLFATGSQTRARFDNLCQTLRASATGSAGLETQGRPMPMSDSVSKIRLPRSAGLEQSIQVPSTNLAVRPNP